MLRSYVAAMLRSIMIQNNYSPEPLLHYLNSTDLPEFFRDSGQVTGSRKQLPWYLGGWYEYVWLIVNDFSLMESIIRGVCSAASLKSAKISEINSILVPRNHKNITPSPKFNKISGTSLLHLESLPVIVLCLRFCGLRKFLCPSANFNNCWESKSVLSARTFWKKLQTQKPAASIGTAMYCTMTMEPFQNRWYDARRDLLLLHLIIITATRMSSLLSYGWLLFPLMPCCFLGGVSIMATHLRLGLRPSSGYWKKIASRIQQGFAP